jgi:hypothetical protein
LKKISVIKKKTLARGLNKNPQREIKAEKSKQIKWLKANGTTPT